MDSEDIINSYVKEFCVLKLLVNTLLMLDQ
jgi:hypothetical protein